MDTRPIKSHRPHTQKGPVFGLMPGTVVLKVLIIGEQEAPWFHFALGPINHRTSSASPLSPLDVDR